MAIYDKTEPGEIASLVRDHLIESLRPVKLESIENKGVRIDYLNPPSVTISDGYVGALEYPTISLHRAVGDRIPRKDLVICEGPEPLTQWEEYANDIASLCQKYRVSGAFSLEGRYVTVPHTRGPVVLITRNHDDRKAEIEKMGISPLGNSGDASFGDVFARAATAHEIPYIGLKIGVPQYLPMMDDDRYTRGCYVALRVIENLLEVGLNSEDLKEDADASDAEIDTEAREDPQIAEMVETFEREYDNNMIVRSVSEKMKNNARQN